VNARSSGSFDASGWPFRDRVENRAAMQDRALASNCRAFWAGKPLLALTIAALGVCSCRQDGPLSDEEMEQLRVFMLPPGPPADPSNVYADDPAAAALGKKLYFETRYSGALFAPYNVAGVNGALGAAGESGKVGCASCHDPATAGADLRSRPNQTSLGASYTTRNAPTVINAAYSPAWQFWDGRADSMWSQALIPPEGTAECASSRLKVVHVLYDDYRAEFEAVFGAGSLPASIAAMPANGMPGTNPDVKCTPGAAGEPFNDDYDCLLSDADKEVVNRAYANFGKALEAYERLLISNNFEPSAFDRFMAGETDAMEPAAIRGARLFVGHAGCAECHRGPTFTDFGFHNIGVPQSGQYVPATDAGRFDGVAALLTTNPNVTRFDRGSDFSDAKDSTYLLAMGTTAPTSATGQFKTPTLRNVSKTAPYMHDGAYQTLWEVVNHYNFGGATGNYEGERDPAIAPLMLTDAEMGDLVEFLEALEDGPLRADVDQALLKRP
jgi:cytochrome c peroxidase